ncbi:MAG: TIGR02302 family protein [Sediminimonas sp.]|uniref:TIGR02302 family protein n=1 Tax=Sediminimonas sp. TaxID=2823379 RepID=UPI0028700155|nr:TIGR02302 family protein [Sediminimonas sp.]MDR9483800.1 TIGR02302 family protein [Sediminimonas sp.]
MRDTSSIAEKRLRRTLLLTWVGLLSERLARAFWPVWSLLIAVLGALMLGLQDRVSVDMVWGLGALAGVAGGVLTLLALWRMRWPRRAEALARLDATLPGRPLQTLRDSQAVGAQDEASAALWGAHLRRMEAQAADARPVRPNLRLAPRDPFALRYAALLLLMIALLFGSLWRVGSVRDLAPGGGAALAAGPAWEGWIEPPAYTGLPALYLPDLPAGAIEVAQGATVTLRVYGDTNDYSVTSEVAPSSTVSGDGQPPEQAGLGGDHSFEVVRSGTLSIDGPGGREWDVRMRPDTPPRIEIAGEAETSAEGQMSLPFKASDDYGVKEGQARITLDMDALNRRHGLAAEPEPRAPVTLDLPMPIAGDKADFTEHLIEDFSKHPWAHLPVKVELSATDEIEQKGKIDAEAMTLPARRFFDPLASAIIEQRRDLLWSRENAGRVARVLRALSHRPEEKLFRSDADYLRLRVILRRLEAMTEGGLSKAQRDETAQALWDLAISLEEGDIDDARERLSRAQERLNEAMRNGASDQEIARLMQELRDATQDYMRQLAQQSRKDGDQQAQQSDPENTMQMTQNDLQEMMDRIQKLMEQGRMAEAQQALQELQQLMENMRVTQGQGGQSQGQQAMEGLSKTLREQQGLSDQAFRDLQEQFNPDAKSGQSQGNEGRNGGQGRGQSHDGQGSGQGSGQGQQGAEPGQQDGQGSLAERQRALREELNRQRGNLPGAGTPEGEAARDALDRAGRAMDSAEEALRDDDLAEAIDQQSQAMEGLREGMRNLGEAMAQDQPNQGRGQGQQRGDANGQARDPLGRSPGRTGPTGTRENVLQGEDVYRRARELLDEIRRRSGDRQRDEKELEYLKRLLERF